MLTRPPHGAEYSFRVHAHTCATSAHGGRGRSLKECKITWNRRYAAWKVVLMNFGSIFPCIIFVFFQIEPMVGGWLDAFTDPLKSE